VPEPQNGSSTTSPGRTTRLDELELDVIPPDRLLRLVDRDRVSTSRGRSRSVRSACGSSLRTATISRRCDRIHAGASGGAVPYLEAAGMRGFTMEDASVPRFRATIVNEFGIVRLTSSPRLRKLGQYESGCSARASEALMLHRLLLISKVKAEVARRPASVRMIVSARGR
jgi:hypothetical protein